MVSRNKVSKSDKNKYKVIQNTIIINCSYKDSVNEYSLLVPFGLESLKLQCCIYRTFPVSCIKPDI